MQKFWQNLRLILFLFIDKNICHACAQVNSRVSNISSPSQETIQTYFNSDKKVFDCTLELFASFELTEQLLNTRWILIRAISTLIVLKQCSLVPNQRNLLGMLMQKLLSISILWCIKTWIKLALFKLVTTFNVYSSS